MRFYAPGSMGTPTNECTPADLLEVRDNELHRSERNRRETEKEGCE
jgi:hypothetical protein